MLIDAELDQHVVALAPVHEPHVTLANRAIVDVINGDVPDSHGWLTYVYPAEAPLREPAKAVAGKSR